MPKSTFVFIFLIFATAQARDYSHLPPYYPLQFKQYLESDQTNSEELKEKLFRIISGYHKKQDNGRDLIAKEACSNCFQQKVLSSYREARRLMFGKIDLKRDDKGHYINDRYCGKRMTAAQGIGPGRIPNHQYMNCEHTWPQSRFNKRFSSRLQKTDLHHLFPVDSKANSQRGNVIFGVVEDASTRPDCQLSKRGYIEGTNAIGFEPPPSHRGNIARALFYFSIRYKINIDDLEEQYLRNWHKDDPVDDDEKQRNNKIFEIQNNRNPFIDDPLLADSISDF